MEILNKNSEPKALSHANFLGLAHNSPDSTASNCSEMDQGVNSYLSLDGVISLNDLVKTLKYIERNRNSQKFRIGNPITLKNGKTFVYSKYLKTAVVPKNLQSLLEEMGKDNWEVKLWGYKPEECPNCGEKVYAKVGGNRFQKEKSNGNDNPFMRRQSSRVSASNQAKKIDNLLSSCDCEFMTLTFPKEISKLYQKNSNDILELVTKQQLTRKEIEEKCWKTLKKFYKKLEKEKCSSSENLMSSNSLHIWKTENPLIEPHFHFHSFFPLLKIRNFPKSEAREIALRSLKRKLELREQTKKDIEEIEDEMNKLRESNLNNYEEIKEKKRVYHNLKNIFESISREINEKIRKHMGVEKISRVTKNKKGKSILVPLHDKKIKKFWKESIEEVFEIEIDKKIDVHLKFFKNYNKAQVLHTLYYKNRPPILDVSMFLHRDTVENYILFEQNREWVKQLISYNNRSRVLGGWNAIKNLQKIDEPDDGVICSICGGLCPIGNRAEDDLYLIFPKISNIIQKNGSELRVFNSKPPPNNLYECKKKKRPKSIEDLVQSLEFGRSYSHEELLELGFTDSGISHVLETGRVFSPRAGRYKKL